MGAAGLMADVRAGSIRTKRTDEPGHRFGRNETEGPVDDRGARWFLAAVIPAAVLYFMLDGAARGGIYAGLAVAAALSVAAGVRNLPGPRPRAWLGFALGVGLMAAGDVVWFWYEHVLRVAAPYPSVADAFFFVGTVAVAVSLLVAAQAERGAGGAALLDALLVTTGVSVAAWPLLYAPLVPDPAVAGWGAVVAVSTPITDAFMLAVLARLMLGGTTYSRAAPYLAVGITAMLASDAVYARLVLTGVYDAGHPLDAGWIVMYACFGAVGRLPNLGMAPRSPRRRREPRTWWVVPTVGALLVPLTIATLWARGQDLSPVVWAPAAVAVVVLGWARIRARAPVVQEAAAVGLAAAVALLVALQVRLFDRLDALLHHPSMTDWAIDELAAALPVVAVALAVFAWRRWREAAAEVEARRATEERLVAARQEAEAANHAKTVFLSTMSHELRTPMNAIIGYAHLLLDGMSGPLTPEQDADVRQIADGGDRLLRLIDDILDLSRIEAGRLELATEPVDVGAVLADVCAEVAPLAAAKDLALEVYAAPGLVVRADPLRLRQVVLNLAGNAVKFTEHGGVSLEASLVPGGVEIAVADSGIGIAPEAMPHVFDEFRQADAGTARRYQGSGLGLAIVHRLVRLHGGTVAVESEPGRGSIFTVRLPAEGVPTAGPGSGNGIHPDAAGAHRAGGWRYRAARPSRTGVGVDGT